MVVTKVVGVLTALLALYVGTVLGAPLFRGEFDFIYLACLVMAGVLIFVSVRFLVFPPKR